MNCNWSVSAGLLWLSTLALAIWLLSPSQILVGDKWMDRADVILQSDEIAGRNAAIAAVARAAAANAASNAAKAKDLEELQNKLNDFCAANMETDDGYEGN